MRRIAYAAFLASSLIAAIAPAYGARAPAFILVGLDGKTFYGPEGVRNGPNGRDALAFVDISDEAHPQVIDTLQLDNSVNGPTTNLQITPDGRLGLLASSVTMRRDGEAQDGAWTVQSDDRLHVIDMTAAPPSAAATLKVGRRPSGLAINGAGDLALVANREDGSVTVLTIAESTVSVIGTVELGDEVAAVTFSPDGRRAFVAKNIAGKVGVLAIDGPNISYDPKLDIPVGSGVSDIGVTPDAKLGLSVNSGPSPSDGHVDSISVIAASSDPPKVIDWLGIGDTPVALDIAPDGRHAVVSVVRGSAAPKANPEYTQKGRAVLLAIDQGGGVRYVGEAEAGALPRGVLFSPSGRYVYLANYNDRNLQVFRVEGDGIVDTGYKLGLPGQPASLGGRARG